MDRRGKPATFHCGPCWITFHRLAGAEYRIASEIVRDRVRIWLFGVYTGEQTDCYFKQPGEQTYRPQQ